MRIEFLRSTPVQNDADEQIFLHERQAGSWKDEGLLTPIETARAFDDARHNRALITEGVGLSWEHGELVIRSGKRRLPVHGSAAERVSNPPTEDDKAFVLALIA